MENVKSIELENMRKELESLKAVLQSQQIVNEKYIRRTMDAAMNKEKRSIHASIAMAVVATVIYFYFFPKFGIPLWFTIVTTLFFAVAIAASIFSTHRLGSVSLITGNLIDAATRITEYKRFGNNWLKFSIPFVTVWLGAFIYYGSAGMPHDMRYGFWGGCAVGLVFGIVGGIRYLIASRHRLDDIMRQIEELEGE